MTNAKGYNNTNIHKFNGRQASECLRVSVGFETKSSYKRHKKSESTSALAFARSKNHISKSKYIAPSAEVVLMPGTLERTAINELLSTELTNAQKNQKKKTKNSKREIIEPFAIYNESTGEIFTEELEINVLDGAAFKDANNKKNILSDMNKIQSKEQNILKAFKANAESTFKSFAQKLSKLSLKKNDSAG